jgi:hypothetical protein
LDKDNKNCSVRLDTLKFGVYDAVLYFNDDVAKQNGVIPRKTNIPREQSGTWPF